LAPKASPQLPPRHLRDRSRSADEGTFARRFAVDGFAVLERFLSPSELAAARFRAEERARAPADPTCMRPHNTLLPLRFDDPLVDLVLAAPERVERVGSAVGATDLRWISGYLSIKEPNSEALWWHQDWWCWGHPASFAPEAPQVALLCYLSGTDRRHGALRVWPGSHRTSTRLHALLPEAHKVGMAGLALDHAAMSDHPEQLTLAAHAGDAAIIDYRLLHGTYPNASATRRDCLVLNFAPAWRLLPEDLRAHLISNFAQPRREESPAAPWGARLLPSFEGVRADLPLNRDAPAQFGQG
jgi:phytanoyl-CoA dioxygenase PhyH